MKPKKPVQGLSQDQIALMENETASLDREFKAIEQDYGDLVLATGYLARLLGCASVVRYLAQFYPEILSEFQKITDLRRAA